MIVGPAVAGLILARFGLTWAYGADVVSFAASFATVLAIRPLPPQREGASPGTSPWQEIKEGFAYLRGKRVLISTFLIDLDAMIFGMPRALFPVLALTVFRVGPRGLGFLYAAPAAGALVGALTAGWVGRVRHQGRAVIWAVAIWGAAITGFGLSGRLFAAALCFLFVAGAADVISAVFRGAILQLSVPDSLRGRLSAVHLMVVPGGPPVGRATSRHACIIGERDARDKVRFGTLPGPRTAPPLGGRGAPAPPGRGLPGGSLGGGLAARALHGRLGPRPAALGSGA